MPDTDILISIAENLDAIGGQLRRAFPQPDGVGVEIFRKKIEPQRLVPKGPDAGYADTSDFTITAALWELALPLAPGTETKVYVLTYYFGPGGYYRPVTQPMGERTRYDAIREALNYLDAQAVLQQHQFDKKQTDINEAAENRSEDDSFPF